MQEVLKNAKGLSMLVWLNWDRLFIVGTIVVVLLAGAFLGSALVQPWSRTVRPLALPPVLVAWLVHVLPGRPIRRASF